MENDKNNIIIGLLELQTHFEHQFNLNNQSNQSNKHNNNELIKHYNELLISTISNTINFINHKTIVETKYETKSNTKIKNYKHSTKEFLDSININYIQLSKLN